MLYKKIAFLCENRGISIRAFEKEMGFGNGTISKWKESSPSVEKLQKIATYFNVTIDELLKK